MMPMNCRGFSPLPIRWREGARVRGSVHWQAEFENSKLSASLPRRLRPLQPLPADTTHRATRGHKIDFSDMMPFFLLPNHSLEPFEDVFILTPIAQHGAKIVFRHAEQARADFAIGRHPNAIAMAAERFADRRDNSDFTTPILKGPTRRGLRGILRTHWLKCKARSQALQNFVARHDHFFQPGARRIQRH